LVENAVQGPRAKIVVPVPGDGYSPLLERMLVLAMTAFLGDLIPAVLLSLIMISRIFIL